jgi:hypothetical protein
MKLDCERKYVCELKRKAELTEFIVFKMQIDVVGFFVVVVVVEIDSEH